LDSKDNEENNGANEIKLGLRQNIQQFLILVLVNAFVGAMIGLEQTVVPLIGKNEFGIESNAIIVSFIASFGAVKAILNLYAGNLSDRWGRKNVLVLGWLFGIPVPFILLFAPDWNWIIFANVLLGINQGLAWSMTVNMKIDLVGKERRGLALGLNEFAGYVSVAVVGFVTGYLAATYGLKPYSFYLGIAFAVLGFVISWAIVKDTRKFTVLEIEDDLALTGRVRNKPDLNFKQVFLETSWMNRTLLSVSQAGLINNLIFGVTWGLFTLYYASFSVGISEIGFLKALHPGIWGVLQLVTGSLSESG
jgi:MFS family permease